MRFFSESVQSIPRARAGKSCRLEVTNLEAREVPAAYDLGAAADFNLVALNDINVFNSDIEGRVAVADDAQIKSYGIGDKLTNSNGTRDDLIVGHDLNFQYGQVYFGNIVYGNNGTLDGVGTPNGTVRQEANVVDFAAISADVSAKSTLWGGEAPNGITSVHRGTIRLRGTNPTLDIFTLTPDQLADAKNIILKVPSTATVLINVPGSVVNIENLGYSLRGVSSSQVVWNFPEATDINLSGIGIQANFLAPHANFNFNNGQIEGTVIADSFIGNGELHFKQSNIRIDIPPYGCVHGLVFVDEDKNHVYDSSIDGLQGFAGVYLTGTDVLGRHINRYVLTDNDGKFDFDNLWSGNYTVRLEVPFKYIDSQELGIPGTVNGNPVGTPGVNKITSITIGVGEDSVDNQLALINTRG